MHTFEFYTFEELNEGENTQQHNNGVGSWGTSYIIIDLRPHIQKLKNKILCTTIFHLQPYEVDHYLARGKLPGGMLCATSSSAVPPLSRGASLTLWGVLM